MSAECESCGVTAADLPFEDMGLTLEEASDVLFEHEGGVTLCVGCGGAS